MQRQDCQLKTESSIDLHANRKNGMSTQAKSGSRRDWLCRTYWGVAAGGLSLGLPLPSGSLRAEENASKKLLKRPIEIQQLDTRAKIVLELEGKLFTKPLGSEGEVKPRESEVQAKSTLDYFERSVFTDGNYVVSARRYNEAMAENWVAGKASKQVLRPECNTTLVMKYDGVWQQYCPKDTLEFREAQLLRSPLNTGMLEYLLPEQPARPDSSWKIDAPVAMDLFNLEAVHKSDLTAKIAKIENGVATIELAGSVEGTANSVPTSMTISGNFRAQVVADCIMVTWVGLSIREEREISQAEPGFAIQARVRLIRTEAKDELAYSDQQLRELAANDEPGRWLVSIRSNAGSYEMLADRKWQTYVDSPEESMLRLIENDMVVAQCNISQLPRLNEGLQWTLEGLQADIQKTLGDRFEQFLESSERVSESGLRLLRCVVSGSTEDVPIQWIYNHFSDDSGRRVSMVFTMGANMTDRFASADIQMASSFEFLQADGGTPTPAPEEVVERSAAKTSEATPK